MSLTSEQEAKFKNHINKHGFGGQGFSFAGMATNVQSQADKNTGEIKGTVNITYVGGEKYVRFADPADVRYIPDGAWITVEADVREFKDQTYASNARLVTVNGKPVERRPEEQAA